MLRIDPSLTDFLKELQRIIGRLIEFQPLRVEDIENVCGVDVSYSGKDAVATAVLWSLHSQRVVEKAEYRGRPAFPYVPGFLFMREGPLMLAALQRLHTKPSLILVDGQGVAHPRRAGIAVFIGLLTDIPTIGVAKSILVGILGEAMGAFTPIFIDGVKVGYAVTMKSGRRYYMSPGHKVGVEDIIKIVQFIGFDYPQPLKEAHRMSKDRVKDDG